MNEVSKGVETLQTGGTESSRITELEQWLDRQIAAKDPDTFLYRLNKRGWFDARRLKSLVDRIDELAGLYRREGKSEDFPRIANGVLVLFEHTLFLFYCHASTQDAYSIVRPQESVLAASIPRWYARIRETTANLIF